MGRARAAAAVSASRRSCSLRRIGGPAAAKPVGGGAEASAGGALSGAVPAGPLCSVRSTERASGVSLSPTGHLRHPGRGWSRRVESHGRAQRKNLAEDRRDQPVVSFTGCYATVDNCSLSELAAVLVRRRKQRMDAPICPGGHLRDRSNLAFRHVTGWPRGGEVMAVLTLSLIH